MLRISANDLAQLAVALDRLAEIELATGVEFSGHSLNTITSPSGMTVGVYRAEPRDASEPVTYMIEVEG